MAEDDVRKTNGKRVADQLWPDQTVRLLCRMAANPVPCSHPSRESIPLMPFHPSIPSIMQTENSSSPGLLPTATFQCKHRQTEIEDHARPCPQPKPQKTAQNKGVSAHTEKIQSHQPEPLHQIPDSDV